MGGQVAAPTARSDLGIDRVGRAMDLLTVALLSHFSYEERELVEPLARHGLYRRQRLVKRRSQ